MTRRAGGLGSEVMQYPPQRGRHTHTGATNEHRGSIQRSAAVTPCA
jgi:hypothetical protein